MLRVRGKELEKSRARVILEGKASSAWKPSVDF